MEVQQYSSMAVQQYSSEALVRQYSRNTKKEMDGCYIFFSGERAGGQEREGFSAYKADNVDFQTDSYGSFIFKFWVSSLFLF